MMAFKVVGVTRSAVGAFALSREGHQRHILGLQNEKENNLGILKMELSEQQFTSCSTAERNLQIQI